MSELVIDPETSLAACGCGWSGIPVKVRNSVGGPVRAVVCPMCVTIPETERYWRELEDRARRAETRARTAAHEQASLERRATNVVLEEAKRLGLGRNDLCPCGSGRKLKKCHDK